MQACWTYFACTCVMVNTSKTDPGAARKLAIPCLKFMYNLLSFGKHFFA